jgi:hypothetical protein
MPNFPLPVIIPQVPRADPQEGLPRCCRLRSQYPALITEFLRSKEWRKSTPFFTFQLTCLFSCRFCWCVLRCSGYYETCLPGWIQISPSPSPHLRWQYCRLCKLRGRVSWKPQKCQKKDRELTVNCFQEEPRHLPKRWTQRGLMLNNDRAVPNLSAIHKLWKNF